MPEAKVIHSSQPQSHPLQEYALSLEKEHPRGLVLDRWHLGQWVYPQIYPDGRDMLTPEQWLWIELFLLSRGATLTYLEYDFSELAQRVSADRDSYLKPEDVEACSKLFYLACNNSILPTMSVRHGNPMDVARLSNKAWVNWTKYSLNTLRFPYAIGNMYEPDVLLVGDELGPVHPVGAKHRVPFAPYPDASGNFLMRALLEWKREVLGKIALINSKKPNGDEEDLWSLWVRLGRPQVVGLGAEADARLVEQSVPHGSLPHPQYVRRFHHHKVSEYSKAIKSVSESGLSLFGKEFNAILD